MADIALARQCPACGTLVTVAGSFKDELLVATCPHCTLTGRNTVIEVVNPRYQAPDKDAPPPAIEEGKHNVELTEKYTDATGDHGTAPFRKQGAGSGP